ncbi:hypothetical protein [Allokutzneria sp. NRRL B-24872]|uniref:hypothetical protein n=1 Tax=Allokutzneria sp. NRRL B-24872 TaxID=1137961 RepID=UPI000A37D425|nr:hypothetical protein [Allokutzneria sp. NRRL B-24872]
MDDQLSANRLPWLRWLPADERADCLMDLRVHLEAGADTGNLLPFSHAMAAWRSTAEVWRDPELAARLRTPFSGIGEVIARPTAAHL